jgi:hypothetical protein
MSDGAKILYGRDPSRVAPVRYAAMYFAADDHVLAVRSILLPPGGELAQAVRDVWECNAVWCSVFVGRNRCVAEFTARRFQLQQETLQ